MYSQIQQYPAGSAPQMMGGQHPQYSPNPQQQQGAPAYNYRGGYQQGGPQAYRGPQPGGYPAGQPMGYGYGSMGMGMGMGGPGMGMGGMYPQQGTPYGGGSGYGAPYMRGGGPGMRGGFRGGRAGGGAGGVVSNGNRENYNRERQWQAQVLCCYHVQGSCRYGDKCRYSHDDNGQECHFGLSCRHKHYERAGHAGSAHESPAAQEQSENTSQMQQE
eukprot:PhM_4_TR15584/c0_g1_i1/m.64447